MPVAEVETLSLKYFERKYLIICKGIAAKCNIPQKGRLMKQLNRELGEAITFLTKGFDENEIGSPGNYAQIKVAQAPMKLSHTLETL